MSFFGWVALALFASSLFLNGGDALSTSLTVNPHSILSDEKLCPNTVVRFTCIAYNVRVLEWLQNNNQLGLFTSQDMPSNMSQTSGVFELYLNNSVRDDQNNINVTSTLIGLASNFQTGDRIACPELNGAALYLNFTTNTPPPDGFQVSVSKGSTDEMLYLNILWDSEFNTAYEIESYQIEASNGFIDCPQMCSPRNDNPCQCSELRAGTNGNITITATSCGDLQGPPTVITITPEVPDQISTCSSYPVYNSSNLLYLIEITWSRTTNLPTLTSGVSLDISGYDVSVNGEVMFTNCSSINSNCFYSYNVQPPVTISTVTVSAKNIFGNGQERTCSIPPNTNVDISPMNDIFTITLSSTNLNRTVDCNRLTQRLGLFLCQFCVKINNLFTCYDLDNSSSNAANTALTGLGEGTYFYRATVFLDDIPIASIYDFFSTACQLDELGRLEDRIDSQCLAISGGMVCYNGTVADSVATYTCSNGNITTRMCRIDGRWEGNVPSCEIVVASWVIPLFVVSIIFWFICLLETGAITPISFFWSCKNRNERILVFSSVMLAVRIILILFILIFWIVYATGRNSLRGRNFVIVAFVFSLVLVGLSIVDVIVVLLHRKSTVYDVQRSGSKGPPAMNNSSQDSDDDDRHEGIQQ